MTTGNGTKVAPPAGPQIPARGGPAGNLDLMTRATGRRTRVAEPTWFRLMLAGGVLLGVVATVLVVVSEEARWLRLAVLAALWAALLAAFALSRARREARTAELKQEEGKRTYELELQREITARREYEAKVTEHARLDSDDRHREELAAIREQLDKLTQTLSGLLDGDVLVERLTLSAESTRVRQLGGDRGRLIGGSPGVIGQGMGPYPQRPLGPPPPHRPSPVPPATEEDTVQINLTKITEHARAVRAGTTTADTAVPAAASADVVPAAGSASTPEVPDAADAEVVPEAVADAEIVSEAVVEEPTDVEPVADEVAADEVEIEADELEEVLLDDDSVEPEVAAVTEDPTVDPEPAVGDVVIDEVPVEDAPAEDAVVEEPVAEESVAEEPADDVSVVEAPEVDESVFEEQVVDDVPAEEPVEAAAVEPAATGEPAEENHHNAGVSVSDLLAAYGISSERRPRRRRAVDDDDDE